MRRPWLFSVLLPVLAACSGAPATGGAGGAGGSGSAASGGGSSSASGSASSGSQAESSAASGATSSAASSSGSGGGSSSATSSSSGGQMGSPCSHSLPEYTGGNGSVTYYTVAPGSPVNCGFDVLGQNPDVIAHVATGNGQYFGAMNTADYNTAATCGACVEVTRDNSKKVVVTIVDQCPTNGNPVCTAGHIDLSQAAFLQIGTQAEGYLGTGNGGAFGVISWQYVACPTNEDVTFRLKEPQNAFWNQILVEAHRYAITKVEAFVNGQWVAATRQSYNYWQVGNGDLGPAPYKVRATDVNGDTVEAQLDLVAGDQSSGTQFPLCQ